MCPILRLKASFPRRFAALVSLHSCELIDLISTSSTATVFVRIFGVHVSDSESCNWWTIQNIVSPFREERFDISREIMNEVHQNVRGCN